MKLLAKISHFHAVELSYFSFIFRYGSEHRDPLYLPSNGLDYFTILLIFHASDTDSPPGLPMQEPPSVDDHDHLMTQSSYFYDSLPRMI